MHSFVSFGLRDYIARVPVAIGARRTLRSAKFGAGTSLNKYIDINGFPIYPNAYLPKIQTCSLACHFSFWCKWVTYPAIAISNPYKMSINLLKMTILIFSTCVSFGFPGSYGTISSQMGNYRKFMGSGLTAFFTCMSLHFPAPILIVSAHGWAIICCEYDKS